MKKIIVAVALAIAVSVVSTDVRAWEMSATDGSASVTGPDHRLSVFATVTNFPKNDAVDKYDTAYRFAGEFESDVLRKGDFALIPGMYYTAIGIDKDKKEYTINPAVAGSVRYNILGGDFIQLQVGYGTNGGDKSGPIYSAKFNFLKFENGVTVQAGAIFSNIGESVNSFMVGVSFPIN